MKNRFRYFFFLNDILKFRIYTYFTGVRKASLQTLLSLVSRPILAASFLPPICASMMSHLYEQSILESHEENLKLIEESWNQICDHCPLAALLTATCPLYGKWLVLISKPHMWPLPNDLLFKVGYFCCFKKFFFFTIE